MEPHRLGSLGLQELQQVLAREQHRAATATARVDAIKASEPRAPALGSLADRMHALGLDLGSGR